MNSITFHAHKIDEGLILPFMEYCYNLIRFIAYQAAIEDFTFSSLNISASTMNLAELKELTDLCLDIGGMRAKYRPHIFVKALIKLGGSLVGHMKRTVSALDANQLRGRHKLEMETLICFEMMLDARNRRDCLPLSVAPLLLLHSDYKHNSCCLLDLVSVGLILREAELNRCVWQFSQRNTNYMRPENILVITMREVEKPKPPFPWFHLLIVLLVLVIVYKLFV